MRIYLAGPDVFLPDAHAVLARKAEICRAHGFVGVSPFDTGDDVPPPTADGGREISRRNEALMRRCDLVVANMTPFRGPSMDAGTAFEMGFMRALGRVVLGYSTVDDTLLERSIRLCRGRRVDDRWVDEDGLTIEDFQLGDNLMLDGAALESSGTIVRIARPEHDRFTDLTAFTACVAAAAALRAAGRLTRHTQET